MPNSFVAGQVFSISNSAIWSSYSARTGGNATRDAATSPAQIHIHTLLNTAGLGRCAKRALVHTPPSSIFLRIPFFRGLLLWYKAHGPQLVDAYTHSKYRSSSSALLFVDQPPHRSSRCFPSLVCPGLCFHRNGVSSFLGHPDFQRILDGVVQAKTMECVQKILNETSSSVLFSGFRFENCSNPGK